MGPSPVEQVRLTSLVLSCVTCQGGDVRFELVAGRPVLDFVATVAERRTTRVEHLRSGADLADWVAQAGLVDRRLRVDDDDLARAVALREALFRLVSAVLDGTAVSPQDRALVNATAASPGPTLHLTADGAVRRTGDLDAVLALLAWDLLDLLGSPDRAALRWCADPACTRVVLDRSRGHRRRWCGMRGCGDRAKAAAYRQRKRAVT
jgi:predicted RNA-binding Zn ribbon-like protein